MLTNLKGARDRMREKWHLAIWVGVLSPLSYILVLSAIGLGAPVSLVASWLDGSRQGTPCDRAKVRQEEMNMSPSEAVPVTGPSAAVIGLGSMGFGMAQSLLRAGLRVVGCDLAPTNLERLVAAGGRAALTPAEAARNADIVVCVVINAAQTEAVLFGPNGAAESMAEGTVFVSCATMEPEVARGLAARLEATGRLYLDAPISGGSRRAAEGQLTILASGCEAAFAKARPALDPMAAKLYELGAEPGVGAAFKMINQLLAGVHIAAACEAMAFAAKQGLDLRKIYEVITGSAGNSWMFENRVPHILAGDYRPLSAVEIFVKDLGIVQDMAQAARFPVPLAAAALQMYVATAGAGMGGDDDSSLARVYAALSGTTLPGAADQ